ncbi:zinc finger protein 658B [Cololabis saira]|uniref:zinc finger protein 658B n=1 Tax=Cololabis saira TaxID=129043 RepID=UPI002AD21B20|nr:zinc finger protein 658B [Cololabis saira]XP_061572530.1 zinc finger protein 658B [Cololabis saira]
MMLGLQGNASSPKVYRCVACSATFTGLASLLVHQATHASTLSKTSAQPPTQPDVSLQEAQHGSTDSASEHRSPPARLPESPSPSFYICDCGEEFQNFGVMLEHKRSHVPQMQSFRPLEDNTALTSGTESDMVFSTASFTPVNQTDSALSCPSTSKAPAAEVPTLNSLKEDVALEDHVAMVTSPQGQCTPPQDISEIGLENVSTTAELIPETAEDMYLQAETFSEKKAENLPRNNTLMKLLASAYMSRIPPRPSENQSKKKFVPKQEVIPVDITLGAKADVSQINDLSIAHLRRLLAKPDKKTKAPSIGRILESSRKRVVSLTKTLSPVVVLETRQKLMDPVAKGSFGRYQCGRCRKVFPNLDRLTEHHFLHKKERIKCCRRCKQLIIGRLPFPDNHVCPHLGHKNTHPSGSFMSKFPPKIVPFHGLNSAKKVFFCPLCKHSYARRWNLKTHRCHGSASAPQRHFTPFQKMFTMRSNSIPGTVADEDKNGCLNSKSVAVGTDVGGHIKIEMSSANSEQSAASLLAWTHPAKTFSPFSLKSFMKEPNPDVSVASLEEEIETSLDAESIEDEDSNEGQWTMPLDDEIQVLNSAGKPDDDGEVKASGSAEHEGMAPQSLRYFVQDGVKRYPCNKCQKTYSRASTLRRHLRLCGFRPPGFGIVARTDGQGAFRLNVNNERPMFPCFVCGKTFNRKDNMMAHRKKCQLQRTLDVELEAVQHSSSGSAATDCQTDEDDPGNWGIMALPSVLPRRVTCECGAGFTSPKLLVAHLQKHAKESYTCPSCGETVGSWADYEVHLQIHMNPHRQLLQGIKSNRLLQFQPSQQQSSPSPLQRPQKTFHSLYLPNLAKKQQQRIVCTRCGNTFATRCSLRRHITWNRCKGARAANQPTNAPKSFRCSHCSSDFPNSISLIFHQRNGACKPAIKPVRCPVCLRWFGTGDSLQKHLLTHRQTEQYRCDVCQGTYPNLKSLKNHRRRIHRIMAGDILPQTPEPMTS